MSTRRIPAGEFNHDPVGARRLAEQHDVIVEVRGEPTTVMVSFERYQRMVGGAATPLDLVYDQAAADIEFEPGRVGDLPRVADL